MSTPILAPIALVGVHQLVTVVRNRVENILLIDSRSFLEYNGCHIASAVNICSSKIVKRRLQQDKLTVKELLIHTCNCDIDEKSDIVVYDQSSKDAENLPVESFAFILLKKLQLAFRSVNFLSGGFDEFFQNYPDLCDDKTRKCPPLTSLSQPCLPIANQGPTRILPFLYLGSQLDALNKELLKNHNITYELNVSTTCPQPEFVAEGHFMRIPVNDTYSEKLLPYFPEAFNFLDKVREGNSCALIHCLAGISRSPTVAIAYVMRYLHLSSDDGYRYVKSKRPTISPNFNFLGQLLEYEKQLQREKILDSKPEVLSAPPVCSQKRLCRTDMRTTKLSLKIEPQKNVSTCMPNSGDQSPTSALAKLSFDVKNGTSSLEDTTHQPLPDFKQFRSKSCYGDWLRDGNETVFERKAKEINTAAKVLSPVKEIKCDALISEISTGGLERSSKSKETIRQRIRSYHSGVETSMFSTTDLFSEKSCFSNNSNEQFSLQTLSHHSQIFPSARVSDFLKYNEETSVRMGNLVKCENKNDTFSARIAIWNSEKNLDLLKNEFRDNIQKSGKIVLNNSDENSTQHQKSFLHPFTFHKDVYKRSDSGGTSGFCSESSDCLEHLNDTNKKNPSFKLDIDTEDLEDDVMFKNTKVVGNESKDISKDRIFFPLSFTDSNISLWSNKLDSPLSPSESHLLEDLEQGNTKIETSSPKPVIYSSDDTELHDSGLPISPSSLYSRKRMADFDAKCLPENRSPSRDKRKCEPLVDTVSKCYYSKHKTFFPPQDLKQRNKSKGASVENTYHCGASGDKIGLYRVQSCPGILSHVSSFHSFLEHSSKCSTQKYIRKDSCLYPDAPLKEIFHESCPDVLHLRDRHVGVQFHRERELRPNDRVIQVS